MMIDYFEVKVELPIEHRLAIGIMAFSTYIIKTLLELGIMPLNSLLPTIIIFWSSIVLLPLIFLGIRKLIREITFTRSEGARRADQYLIKRRFLIF